MNVSKLSRNSAVVICRPVLGSAPSSSRSSRSGTGRAPVCLRSSMALSATDFIWASAPDEKIRPSRGTQPGAPRISNKDTLAVSAIYPSIAVCTAARSKPSSPENVTSEMTSKVAVIISSKRSAARPCAGASRATARSAAWVMTGPRFWMLRIEKTGAAVRRCHNQCAPSATKRLSPIAGLRISFVTSDFG